MLFAAETWVAVAFLIFVGILAYFGVHRTVLNAIDERGRKIEGELAEAKRLREEAQAIVADYKAKQAAAEKEAVEIVAAAKADAERLATEAKTKVEDFVARRTKMAEAKIAQAEAQAVAEVRSAAADVATAAAGSVLADIAKGAGGSDLIKAGIAEVKAKLN
ncbi:F0F1 ATP synthase subunit B family protein [Phreatobacter sp. AB_2022a]|uniref:F0F1 ATP synthase subunit B family protein n=1 Tax=Phreatobacter sp. AB_2022a TaxID=3003134 RepID=UPI002286F52B|nr:ATP F0F1 synthase subunit B [Phreatobacter sp. AB_2022a]MCZ0736098.1 ATP F0F1 synthase subunit B [Phreatobacter sp. AB_2022a]